MTEISAPFPRELTRGLPWCKGGDYAERYFDTWWTRFKEVLLDKVIGRDSDPRLEAAMILRLARLIMSRNSFGVMRRIIYGFFGVRTRAECQTKAKDA